MEHKIQRLAVLAMVVAAPLSAQSTFGVVAGLVSSNATFTPSTTLAAPSARTSFAAGISMAMGEKNTIYLAPEAMYVMKGYKYTGGETKLAYAEIPVMVRYTIGKSSMKPFVTAGPTIAFKISCKMTFTGVAEQDCAQAGVSNSGPKSTDFGAAFGAGVHFGKLSVAARYDLGLADISQDANPKVKNHALMLLGGFSF